MVARDKHRQGRPRQSQATAAGHNERRVAMNVSEVLNKAADHIERYGHHKGSSCGPAGPGGPGKRPGCTVGAIVMANLDDTDDQKPAIDAMVAYLGRGLITWNDAPDRTAAEVVEALRACAVIEAAKETGVRVVEPRDRSCVPRLPNLSTVAVS